MLHRLIAVSLLLAPGAVLAHPGDHAGGLAHGFAHPFLGLDHLLAMVIVGVWAARAARRIWLLPTVFVSFMAAGAALGDIHLARGHDARRAACKRVAASMAPTPAR